MTDAWQAHHAHHFHTDDILDLREDQMIYDPTIKYHHHPDFLDECLALGCLVTAFMIWPWSYIGSLVLFVCAVSFFLSENSQQ